MIKVHVPVPGKEYDISIGQGMVGTEDFDLSMIKGRNCLIISDSNVAPLYMEQAMEWLIEHEAGKVAHCMFPAGEGSKHLDMMKSFYSLAVRASMDRKSVVVALGGGVTGDMAGFLASSYMRGIDFIQLPTSLLAMVDSSVGGKVGVDLPEGKNLVGAFWQPLAVIADLVTLKTLPEREIRCGLAEVIKYGVIWDADFFTYLEENIEALNSLDLEVYATVVKRCCEIKAQVVSEDEREGGIRAILNYGHTFGHSIETLGGYSLLNHGEGVSIGMAMAMSLSVEQGMISTEVMERQNRLLKAIGLPTSIDKMEPKKILEGMRSDKKTEAGKINLILPTEELGKVVKTAEIAEAVILKAIASCCS